MTKPATQQRITASDLEVAILFRREDEANKAEAVARELRGVAADNFTLFCEARGIPTGTALVGIQGNEIIVQLPDPPPAATNV